MPEPDFDVAIVGAGIVGAACAAECVAAGLRVGILEQDHIGSGATETGMGHLVVLDHSEPLLRLTEYSLGLWHELSPDLPPEAEFRSCGTIWIAPDEGAAREAERTRRALTSRGIHTEWLDREALSAAEPGLRSGLVGGLSVPGDGVTNATRVAEYLIESRAKPGVRLLLGRAAVRIEPRGVILEDGDRVNAGQVINAAGVDAARLTPNTPVVPRKGHLFEVSARTTLVRHQLVEANYVRTVHATKNLAIAFDAQPRPGGRTVIGASRQYGDDTLRVEPVVIEALRERATGFLPSLAGLQVTRSWAGLRPATPDLLPLIGPCPGLDNVWLATGHEGIGVTASLGTARLLVDLVLGRATEIPADPYSPSRPFPEPTLEPPGSNR